jgi:hypothetical protein
VSNQQPHRAPPQVKPQMDVAVLVRPSLPKIPQVPAGMRRTSQLRSTTPHGQQDSMGVRTQLNGGLFTNGGTSVKTLRVRECWRRFQSRRAGRRARIVVE